MRGRFAILLVLFVGSGCAALIYEIVWFQLLRLTIGASAVSLGIILATFMGGMCLGGLLFHRWISERHHPLAVYGWLELGIAAFGLLNLLLIPAIGGLYFEITGYGYGDILLRGAIAALFLLPPTCLMGATLPAISRHVERSRRGVASLGFLYSANTAGAVLGTVLAGFYLLRVHDTWVATAVAIGLNLGAGGLALALAQRQPRAADSAPPQEPLAAARHGIAFAVIGISGFTALGAQVVWTRLLALYFGGSVYTFSIILAVFLVGLGIGSSAGARLSRSRISPALALAVSQLLLIPALFWGSFAINELIHTLFPFGQLPVDWLVKCANDVLRTGLTLLPATLLWGLSFPLALALVAEPEEDPSRFTGRLYAANTFGAVAGALLFSLWLIPWLGTRSSQQILVGAAALAVLLMVPAVVRPRTTRLFAVAAGTIALAIAAAATPALLRMPPTNPDLSAYGRAQRFWGLYRYVALEEGINSTVAVSEGWADGAQWRQLHVSGKVVASSLAQDMRIERQLGHLPALLHRGPRSALVIGFGAGVTAGALTRHPDIERIVIVEIEPEVARIAGMFFAIQNYDVLNDPRTELIIDDGRHFLATTDERFDLITTDPIHPWVKGAASLYTREFHDLVVERLKPGGVVAQWVPLYESDSATVASQIATFLDAFPHGSIWNSQDQLGAYDVTLIGHVNPMVIHERELSRKLGEPAVRRSLREVGIYRALDLLRLYSGGRKDLSNWLADAEPNLDRNLRLEYLAGTALNRDIAGQIYVEMLSEITYPEALFDLEPFSERALREYYDEIRTALQAAR